MIGIRQTYPWNGVIPPFRNRPLENIYIYILKIEKKMCKVEGWVLYFILFPQTLKYFPVHIKGKPPWLFHLKEWHLRPWVPPFMWENQKFFLGNQMVCSILFGKFQQTSNVIWGKATILVYFHGSTYLDIPCRLVEIYSTMSDVIVKCLHTRFPTEWFV